MFVYSFLRWFLCMYVYVCVAHIYTYMHTHTKMYTFSCIQQIYWFFYFFINILKCIFPEGMPACIYSFTLNPIEGAAFISLRPIKLFELNSFMCHVSIKFVFIVVNTETTDLTVLNIWFIWIDHTLIRQIKMKHHVKKKKHRPSLDSSIQLGGSPIWSNKL